MVREEFTLETIQTETYLARFSCCASCSGDLFSEDRLCEELFLIFDTVSKVLRDFYAMTSFAICAPFYQKGRTSDAYTDICPIGDTQLFRNTFPFMLGWLIKKPHLL